MIWLFWFLFHSIIWIIMADVHTCTYCILIDYMISFKQRTAYYLQLIPHPVEHMMWNLLVTMEWLWFCKAANNTIKATSSMLKLSKIKNKNILYIRELYATSYNGWPFSMASCVTTATAQKAAPCVVWSWQYVHVKIANCLSLLLTPLCHALTTAGWHFLHEATRHNHIGLCTHCLPPPFPQDLTHALTPCKIF